MRTTLAYEETGCLDFARALQHIPPHRAGYLADWPLRQMAGFTCVLRADKRVGYAVTADGTLTMLFNLAEPGAGMVAVLDAIDRCGAWQLTCFDGYLPAYYRRFGFVEVRREAFDPKLAPSCWREEDGTPDVVFMERPRVLCEVVL